MQIDDEFKNLIPLLTNEEFNQLEENILKEGCREPIVLWNDTIVDGHNRYEIHKVIEDDKSHNEWFYITDTVKYILNAFAQIDFVKIDKVESINVRKDAAKIVGILDGQLTKIEKIDKKIFIMQFIKFYVLIFQKNI